METKVPIEELVAKVLVLHSLSSMVYTIPYRRGICQKEKGLLLNLLKRKRRL